MIKRKLYHELIKYIDTKEALIVNGMRQVGKTTILKQIYEEIKSPYKLYLDLENVLSRKYFENDNYEAIYHSLCNLTGAGSNDKIYLFLDEIQKVKSLPSIIKYLGDNHNFKFFLTGSVSFYLKNLFSESMAGRKFLFELTPLSFMEFLKFKNLKYQIPQENKQIDKVFYQTIFPYYEEFVLYGGFPAVVLAKNQQEKEMRIGEIFASYYEKDVINFSDFRKNKVIRDLMLLLLARTGCRLDISKLSLELGISRITLGEYLSFLEATYFIKTIKPFSRNMDAEIRKMPKIYVADSGMANILGKTAFGQTFETAVFHQLYLKRQSNNISRFINYYQKKNGGEIDFILNKEWALEVKRSADIKDLKKLNKISQDLKIKKHNLISYQYNSLDKVIFGLQL